MANEPYLFILTSTINTPHGLIDPETRFQQTIDSINTIKNKVPNSIIMLVENSTELPKQIEDILLNLVDHYIYIGKRRDIIELNRNGVKGGGEAYMLLVAFDYIKNKNIKAKRIFKLSARYKLSNEFDINSYNDMNDNYLFKTRDKHDYQKDYFLHTRMWSFGYSLLDDTIEMISKSFGTLFVENITIEESIFKHINKSKLSEINRIYCEGYIAPWNELIID